MKNYSIEKALKIKDVQTFENYVRRAVKNRDAMFILELKNELIKNFFLYSSVAAKVSILTMAIIEIKSYKWIILFLEGPGLKSKNIDLLVNAIINSNDYKVIYDFTSYLSVQSDNGYNSSIENLIKSLKNSDGVQEYVRFYLMPSLSSSAKDIIIDGLFDCCSGEDIVTFIMGVGDKNLSAEHKERIVGEVLEDDAESEYIFETAHYLTGLTSKDVNDMTYALCHKDDVDGNFITKYATYVPNLEAKDKLELVNAIKRVNKSRKTFEFLMEVRWLSKDDISDLFKNLNLNNLSSDEIRMLSQKYPNETKALVINSNSKSLTTRYAVIMMDLALLLATFKTIEAFALYYLLNKESIGILEKDVMAIFNGSSEASYTDDNIKAHDGPKKGRLVLSLKNGDKSNETNA